MNKFFNYIKNIFKNLLLLSKLIMMLLNFYYLFNYNLYSIIINVSLYLRSFFIIDLPLKTLEHFSISIIIHLTIILRRFYYPESNLFSVAHLASKGGLLGVEISAMFSKRSLLGLDKNKSDVKLFEKKLKEKSIFTTLASFMSNSSTNILYYIIKPIINF